MKVTEIQRAKNGLPLSDLGLKDYVDLSSNFTICLIIVLHFFLDKLFFMHYYIIWSKKMKNFRPIFIKEKILIACQVIVGEKIKPLAKKHKVSRPSVYAWGKPDCMTTPSPSLCNTKR